MQDDEEKQISNNSLVNSGKTTQPISSDIVTEGTASGTNLDINQESKSPVATEVIKTQLSVDDEVHRPQTNDEAFQQVATQIVGSQLQETKIPLPKGVYVVAGLTLLGFVVSFFDTSQNSLLFTMVMLFDLLLGIGLLLRMEIARKLIIWLSVTLVVLSIGLIFLLSAYQQKLEQARLSFDTAVGKLDQKTMTSTQKKELDELQNKVNEQEELVGKAISFSYVKYGASVVYSIVVVLYLTRPKVSEVFEELKK